MTVRLARLEEELGATQRRVDILARRVLDLEEHNVSATDLPAPLDDPLAPVLPEAWTPSGRTQFFVQLASVSFVLVFALGLRTLTDNGVLGPTAGMFAGLGYAAVLFAYGIRRIGAARMTGHVFALCGSLLACLLVVDASARFHILGATTAAVALAATILVTALSAWRTRAPAVTEVPTLAAVLTGLAIGWPDVPYPLTAALIVLALGAAAVARNLRTRSWLEWPVQFATLALWFMWSFRLNRIAPGSPVPDALWPGWVAATLAATVAFHLALPLQRLLRTAADAGIYGFAAPTITVLWAVLVDTATAAEGAARPWSAAGLLTVATVLGAAAVSLHRRVADAAPGRVAALLTAALTAFFCGTWLLPGAPLLALWLWAAAIAGSGVLARGPRQLPARITAIAGTTTALVSAAVVGVFATGPETNVLRALVGLAFVALAAAQHRGLARSAAATGEGAPNRVALGAAHFALLLAVGATFFTLYAFAAHAAAALGSSSPSLAYSIQSTLLAALAIALMLGGARRSRDHARAGFAVLTALGLKVACFDLWSITGIPLVVAVSMLGVAAIAAAIAVRRSSS